MRNIKKMADHLRQTAIAMERPDCPTAGSFFVKVSHLLDQLNKPMTPLDAVAIFNEHKFHGRDDWQLWEEFACSGEAFDSIWMDDAISLARMILIKEMVHD